MIYIFLFALAYALKGGVLEKFKNYERARENSKILSALLNAKFLSISPVLAAGLIYMSEWYDPILIITAWFAAIAPSMGEEHGAVGDKDGALPTYLKRGISDRGRGYDVKKAIQRGVWMGACFAVATWNPIFILTSLLFVPLIWIGQTLNYLILRERGWTLAEPLIGSVCIGLGFLLMEVSWNI